MRRISAELASMPGHPLGEVPFPLLLQRRAPLTLRRHALRSMTRVVLLIAADLLTLLALRFILNGIANQAWLGEIGVTVVRTFVPRGAFPVVQLTTALFLGLLLFGNYRSGDHRHDVRGLLLGTAIGVGLTVWVRIWTNFSWERLVGFGVAMLGIALVLIAMRHSLDTLVRHVRVRLRRNKAGRTLVIGRFEAVQRALGNAALADPSEFNVLGFVDTAPVRHRDALGDIGDVVDIISERRIDTVVLSGAFEDTEWTHLVHIADAAACQVLTLPGALALEGFEPKLIVRRGTPLVQITRPGLRGHHTLLKRALDIAVSGLGLLLLSPLYGAIALAVKLASPGPVFFRQTRVGRGGRYFDILKFRSMVVDAEARLEMLKKESVYGDGRLFKMERDPRITRLGALLRRTSLDELPQLWNVLKGDMSLVGPRPPIPAEVLLYDDHQYTRFDVKPGITGPWQVSGRNQIRDFDEVLRLETLYIRDWSIWKDIGILLRTIPTVLKMDGAY